MNFNINLRVSLSGSCTDIADAVFLKCCRETTATEGQKESHSVITVTATHQSLFSDREDRCLQVQLVKGYTRTSASNWFLRNIFSRGLCVGSIS